jgi:hypothetical protein
MSTAAQGPPTLVDIRAAVDGGVVTAWESEFLIPQQTVATTPVRPSWTMAMPEVLRREQKGLTGSGLIERCKKTGRIYSTARLRTVFLSCRSSVVCG